MNPLALTSNPNAWLPVSAFSWVVSVLAGSVIEVEAGKAMVGTAWLLDSVVVEGRGWLVGVLTSAVGVPAGEAGMLQAVRQSGQGTSRLERELSSQDALGHPEVISCRSHMVLMQSEKRGTEPGGPVGGRVDPLTLDVGRRRASV
ncbi:MAG TPA: hypothetical protein VIB78_13805 [Acidimicrobiia bacterium]